MLALFHLLVSRKCLQKIVTQFMEQDGVFECNFL